MRPARIFLYLVATFTFLVVGAFFVLRIFPDKLTEWAFVPTSAFESQRHLDNSAYADPAMWFVQPGNGLDAEIRKTPEYAEGSVRTAATPGGTAPRYAVFFVHPTTYLERAHWNAPLNDGEANSRARTMIKGLASPFGEASEIWAPRYRQAAIGAFLTTDPSADKAMDAAYYDVKQAFAYFANRIPSDMPIVLAGHSQGSMHLLRMLATDLADSPLKDRVAMVYAIGWPISLQHDLPALGLPACTRPDEAGCVVSWVSFAEPADVGQMMKRYDNSPGFDGQKRGASAILCSNPLTGRQGGTAPTSANRGTLVPDKEVKNAELVTGAVSARCDKRGILLIGDPPDMGEGVLPGNNYHVYDIPLFWANLRADVGNRMRTWATRR